MAPLNVVNAYFEAWKTNQPSRLDTILAPDVEVKGPLGLIKGADRYTQALAGLYSITRHLEIQKQWVDDHDVVTWFELHHAGSDVPIACVNWLKVHDGVVTQVRVAFDPRAILPLMRPGAN